MRGEMRCETAQATKEERKRRVEERSGQGRAMGSAPTTEERWKKGMRFLKGVSSARGAAPMRERDNKVKWCGAPRGGQSRSGHQALTSETGKQSMKKKTNEKENERAEDEGVGKLERDEEESCILSKVVWDAGRPRQEEEKKVETKGTLGAAQCQQQS